MLRRNRERLESRRQRSPWVLFLTKWACFRYPKHGAPHHRHLRAYLTRAYQGKTTRSSISFWSQVCTVACSGQGRCYSVWCTASVAADRASIDEWSSCQSGGAIFVATPAPVGNKSPTFLRVPAQTLRFGWGRMDHTEKKGDASLVSVLSESHVGKFEEVPTRRTLLAPKETDRRAK